MAADLAADKSLDVTRVKGDLLELRVLVDGAEVVNVNPMLYPSPSSVAAKVRAHLVAEET
ncbi:MAG: hypothetical protein ABI556_06740 [Gemmatimonadales bacterium]